MSFISLTFQVHLYETYEQLLVLHSTNKLQIYFLNLLLWGLGFSLK